MSNEAGAGAGMPASGVAPSGNGASAGDGGTVANLGELIKNEVNRALSARLPRVQNTEETIAKRVQEEIAKALSGVDPAVLAQRTAPAAPASDIASGDRPTLKALQEQIQNQNKAHEKLMQELKDEKQRSKEMAQRSRVQAEFAKHLGADSPHLNPYVTTYYNRFVEADGGLAIKFNGDYGEELLPVEQGVKQLFDTELKHLVQQSKAGQLPPAGMGNGVRGTPYTAPKAPTPQGVNPMQEMLYEGLSTGGRPELAEQYARNVLNGNARK